MAESVENDQQILITMALFGFIAPQNKSFSNKNNAYTGGARKLLKESALRSPSRLFTPI